MGTDTMIASGDIQRPVAENQSAGCDALRVPSVLRCGLLIFLVKISLRTRGFGRTVRWLRTNMQAIPEVAAADPMAIRATEYAVAKAGAFYPGRALCLEQSLVLYYALRRQGAPVRFAMGVQAHPLAAHAWVDYQHEPINDVPEHIKRFARLPDELP